jgi:hypothetical protein
VYGIARRRAKHGQIKLAALEPVEGIDMEAFCRCSWVLLLTLAPPNATARLRESSFAKLQLRQVYNKQEPLPNFILTVFSRPSACDVANSC